MIERKRIIFTGRVQGVGFRYRAMFHARDLGLTGFVRNEWDGTVYMEVQGEEERIEKLLYLLQNERYIIIKGMDIARMALVEREKTFGVK